MPKILSVALQAIVLIAAVVCAAVLLAYPTMWAINAVFTSQVLLVVFGVAQLTFTKSLWLTVCTLRDSV